MRIHTDHLTAADLVSALRDAELHPHVWLNTCEPHRSQSRHHAFEVRLRADDGKDREGKSRRWPMGGNDGSGKAATYNEYGYWMSILFDQDPDMVFGPYKGRDDFHAKTRYQF